MAGARLSKKDRERIKEHVSSHKRTLALIRTEHAPTELEPMLRTLAKICGLSLRRTLSSPNSDFGIAELDSRDRMLLVLFVGGKRTELLSVSEADEGTVKDLEDSIHSSNFLSEIIRMGL
jgi:hypothetical protein